MNHDEILIDICMGSSCFCRGNNRNAEVLQSFIRERDAGGRCKVSGHLCQGLCKQGPNLVLAGRAYHEVDPVSLMGLLNLHLKERET